MTATPVPASARPDDFGRLSRIARATAAAAIAGFVGGVVAGVAARVAMRLVIVAVGGRPEFTVEGSLAIVVFGLFLAPGAAVIQVAIGTISPTRRAVRAGAALALLSLAFLVPPLLEPNGEFPLSEFAIAPLLGVGLFAGDFAIFVLVTEMALPGARRWTNRSGQAVGASAVVLAGGGLVSLGLVAFVAFALWESTLKRFA